MRQKIKEVEENNQKSNWFIASFLDFLKSGPKQQFSTLAVRMPNRTRATRNTDRSYILSPTTSKDCSCDTHTLVSEAGANSPSEKLDNELKNLEHLSPPSSDEDDPGVCSHDIYKSSSTTLNTSDATSDKKKKAGKVLNLKFIIMALFFFWLWNKFYAFLAWSKSIVSQDRMLRQISCDLFF